MQKIPTTQTLKKPISLASIIKTMIALVVFFLLLTSVIRLAEKHYRLNRRIKEMKVSEAALLEKSAQFDQINTELDTEDGAERLLREKYNVVKPGEELIIITNETVLPMVAPQKTRAGTWWETLLRGIGIKQ